MYIIIVGLGKTGSTLASQLSEEGQHEIVLVDTREEVLHPMQETLDVATLCGNGACADVLEEAGAEKAGLMIACTDSDEVNLISCMVAKKIGAKHTIARVRAPEYEQNLRLLRDDLHLSMAINPELTAAREIFRILRFPAFLKRQTFFREKAELVEMRITPESPLSGLVMRDLPNLTKSKVLICSVERKGMVSIPHGAFMLEPGDRISLVATASSLMQFCHDLSLSTTSAKRIFIIGGGLIGMHLSKMLLRNHVQVTLIEQDAERCQDLSVELPGATIVNGNGTMQDVLITEGMRDADAVVALTGYDEENLIVSLFASYMGIKKTVTKLNRTEYLDVYNTVGVDTVISPKLLTANAIVRYVRAMSSTSGIHMAALSRIMDEKAEAIEFKVPENLPFINIPFKSLKILPNVLVAAISRGRDVIIPSGNDSLQPGDSVVVITSRDASIQELAQIFQSI